MSNYVKAVFASGDKVYEYIIPEGTPTPKVDDFIITSLGSSGSPTYSQSGFLNVAKVVGVLVDSSKATKPYIMLVSRDDITAAYARNAEMSKRVEEKQRIRAELKRMMQDEGEIMMFEALAQRNPAAAELLKQFKGE